MSTKKFRPYLKWPGSKTKLIDNISSYIPEGSKRIIEPFGGTGTVSLNVAHLFSSAVVNDVNPDLINAHRLVVSEPQWFIEELKKIFVTENLTVDGFKILRAEFNSCNDIRRRSILFVYLNRHCFNGLCRYSAKGLFNTPFGKYDKVYLPDNEILTFSNRLQNATFLNVDFEDVMKMAGEGDFLYCDPPYAPLSETANFTAYASGNFSEEQQKKIAVLAVEAKMRGATVLISNHDTDFTRNLYAQANKIDGIEVTRSISAKSASRKKAQELFAFYS